MEGELSTYLAVVIVTRLHQRAFPKESQLAKCIPIVAVISSNQRYQINYMVILI
ncbi:MULTISPECIES: hypothetical protein [Clostridium]|uniref:hypothetical protein n=1 Tax=Clostridium TaxID=1485 RepID=UPI0014945014|nr:MULTISPECIES: hypothetical protein [Clostridium]NOW15345.1 hypothetical protein [Clostridium acetobutylicum]NRY57024.1 hypothetical protein [Clostridium acetobutylicum]